MFKSIAEIQEGQLEFADQLRNIKKEKKDRCRHNFMYIHEFDHNRDEAIGRYVCKKCGYSEY